MALIKCPHCGGQMSDSAERCPHCGCAAEKANGEFMKEFSRLSGAEQKALREEYDGLTKEFSLVENAITGTKKTYIIFLVILFVFMTAAVVCCVVGYFTENIVAIVLLVVFFAAMCVGFIGCYVALAKLKKVNREQLKQLKKFKLWLKNSKGFTYDIFLTEEEKKIFDSINVNS